MTMIYFSVLLHGVNQVDHVIQKKSKNAINQKREVMLICKF